MKYTSQPAGHGGYAFRPGRRPSLDALPPQLAALLVERDRIDAQLAAAKQRAAELRMEQLAVVATKQDEAVATKAASAGKPIPAPVALPKLLAERVTAEHALLAQTNAFRAIEAECETLGSKLYWARQEQVVVDRAADLAAITAAATALADEVERVIDTYAVTDWLQSGVYDTSAQTWPSEAFSLEEYGLAKHNMRPVRARDLIVGAARAVFTEPSTEK